MVFKETGELKSCPTCNTEASKRKDKEGWWCTSCESIIPSGKLVSMYNEDLKSWREDNAGRDDSDNK